MFVICTKAKTIAHEMRSCRLFVITAVSIAVGADLVRDLLPGKTIAHEMRSYRLFVTAAVSMGVGADLVRDQTPAYSPQRKIIQFPIK